MPDPLRLLGMARKAGRLVLGAAAVEQCLRQGGASLLLVASDAAPNAVRSAERRAGQTGAELLTLSCGKEAFGRAMGRRTCALAALTDDGFARAFKQSLSAAGGGR